jgi:polyphosphate kinase 2
MDEQPVDEGRAAPGAASTRAPRRRAAAASPSTAAPDAPPAAKRTAATKRTAAPATATSATPAKRTAAPATKRTAAPATKRTAAPATKRTAAPATKRTAAAPAAAGAARPRATRASATASGAGATAAATRPTVTTAAGTAASTADGGRKADGGTVPVEPAAKASRDREGTAKNGRKAKGGTKPPKDRTTKQGRNAGKAAKDGRSTTKQGRNGKDGTKGAKDRKRAAKRAATTGPQAEAARPKLKEKDFQELLEPLQAELVAMQRWVQATGAKVVVVFEGRDTAGKGGVIKRIIERVSPRVFHVIALAAPTEREKSQMYIQRYVPHLPGAGEVMIFDRSWYNRAGVERVMGFTPMDEVERFLDTVPNVEKAIVDSGVILLKYWLDVSPQQQTARLQGRIGDPRKIWKLSPMDVQSYTRWDDYTEARDAMLRATHTAWAPWFVVRTNDKKRARLNIISHLLSQVPYEPVPYDPIELPDRAVEDIPPPEGAFAPVPERY